MIAMDRRLLPLPLRLAEIESRLDTLERLMSAPPARTPAARRPPDPIQRVIALVSDRLAVPRRAAQVQALSTLVCSSPSPSSADSGAPGRAS